MRTSTIDIKSIQILDDEPTTGLEARMIEALAQAILDLRGLVSVPIAYQSKSKAAAGVYDLITGHIEYWAYLKALQLDPSLPSTMTVFVANIENRTEINTQREILRGELY